MSSAINGPAPKPQGPADQGTVKLSHFLETTTLSGTGYQQAITRHRFTPDFRGGTLQLTRSNWRPITGRSKVELVKSALQIGGTTCGTKNPRNRITACFAEPPTCFCSQTWSESNNRLVLIMLWSGEPNTYMQRIEGVHCGVVPELVFCKPQVMSAVPLMTTCIVEGGHLPACNQDISNNIRGQPFDAYSISHPWPLKLLDAFGIFWYFFRRKKTSHMMSWQGMLKKWKTFNLIIHINLQCCRRSWRSILSQREIALRLALRRCNLVWPDGIPWSSASQAFRNFQITIKNPGSSWSNCRKSQSAWNQWF